MAHTLGAAALADSFRSSITIILVPLAFLQNESVPAILIPRMQEAIRSGTTASRLAAMTIALSCMGFLLMLITMIGATLIVDAMLVGTSITERQTTINFVHIMAFSMPASVALNCLAAGEIALGKTRVTNVRASILNVGIILGLCMLLLTDQAHILAIAFTLAFNMTALWAVWSLWRENYFSLEKLTLAAVWEEAQLFLSRLVPFLPLPFTEQASIWAERLLASKLATGAIASMDYARTLTDSAYLLLSQPIGLSVLSHGSTENMEQQAKALTRFVVILMMPASAFMFVFAPDIIRIVFQRGAFDEHGVNLSSAALSGISLGLWASTLGWILLRLLNRAGRSRVAAAILVGSYAANFAFNLAMSHLPEAAAHGTLLLGLGETTRSLVLCSGVILALSGSRSLFKLVAMGLIPASAMYAAGLYITARYDGVFSHILLGIGVYGVAVMLATALIAPAAYTKAYSHIVSRRRA
ncbi:lipid II flippase MurJ [Rhizobium oryzicola]|uniref:Lipid II flippase MurJ n=1 Tax=Rhizobium oryzicola TaxID=1232668 RepID=A0ABT8T3P2_9HYPH|nr:lipid II flippase MurJ [Rhizobium oryzicola]MDO1585253.1 lipid II flippase MurJ [Rhizobium oryzicola]